MIFPGFPPQSKKENKEDEFRPEDLINRRIRDSNLNIESSNNDLKNNAKSDEEENETLNKIVIDRPVIKNKKKQKLKKIVLEDSNSNTKTDKKQINISTSISTTNTNNKSIEGNTDINKNKMENIEIKLNQQKEESIKNDIHLPENNKISLIHEDNEINNNKNMGELNIRNLSKLYFFLFLFSINLNTKNIQKKLKLTIKELKKKLRIIKYPA